MTRQVAIAAIIAFAVTVLVISIWEPKAEVLPPPATPAPAAPAPARGIAFKPGLALDRAERFGTALRAPHLDARVELRAANLPGVDAGTP